MGNHRGCEGEGKISSYSRQVHDNLADSGQTRVRRTIAWKHTVLLCPIREDSAILDLIVIIRGTVHVKMLYQFADSLASVLPWRHLL